MHCFIVSKSNKNTFYKDFLLKSRRIESMTTKLVSRWTREVRKLLHACHGQGYFTATGSNQSKQQ